MSKRPRLNGEWGGAVQAPTLFLSGNHCCLCMWVFVYLGLFCLFICCIKCHTRVKSHGSLENGRQCYGRFSVVAVKNPNSRKYQKEERIVCPSQTRAKVLTPTRSDGLGRRMTSKVTSLCRSCSFIWGEWRFSSLCSQWQVFLNLSCIVQSYLVIYFMKEPI